MELLDVWDLNYRALIQRIAAENGGKKAAAYREVAARTKYGSDYAYQVYTGKSGKRVNLDFMRALDEAFADGKAAGWTNIAPGDATPTAVQKKDSPSDSALMLAKMFDSIPTDDPIRRALAFRDAMNALSPFIPSASARSPRPDDQEG